MNKISIRTAIHAFIAERLKGKLEKLKPEEEDKRQELLHTHAPPVWLADAAKRAPQIQLASHTLKAIHPDARGTQINMPDASGRPSDLVGTHTLKRRVDDVVGNAAALDVFKLLKLDIEGESLLSRLQKDEPESIGALSDDAEEAQRLARGFCSVATPEPEAIASHTLAKQVYFPVGDESYHLLSPLFPTSIVHEWHTHLQEVRFSDDAKAARQARRAKALNETGYRNYNDLAFVSLGGSKPQNISQLNSERGGKVYFLCASPPMWTSAPITPPKGESVFSTSFPYWGEVRAKTRALREFLLSVRPETMNDITIRDRRKREVSEIILEFLDYQAALNTLSPGWSIRAPYDDLQRFHRLAFDPLADHDAEDLERFSEWPERVANDFGRWLNSAISSEKTPMGKPEQDEWAGLIEPYLRDIEKEQLQARLDQQQEAA